MIRLIIWGAGGNLQIVYDSINYRKSKIVGIIDSDLKKQKTMWNDIAIYAPSIIPNMEFDYIIVSPFNTEEIVKKCLLMGIPNEKIIVFWNNKREFVFLSNYPRENYFLKKDNVALKLKLDNIRYELGLVPVPKVLEPEAVLKKILIDKSSLCRFGDGEFEMIRLNERPWFQKSNEKLSQRLKEVLASDYDNINIAIANLYGSLEKYTDEASLGMRQYLDKETRDAHMQFIDNKRVYYDAYVTRPYLQFKDKRFCETIFNLWKEIFKNRNLLIVEGINARFGIDNDFLSGALSIRRILCPAKNAFNVYESILDAVIRNVKKDDLVLVTLGPTATVLAYDIAKAGYQAIDIGQVDNEYDWYLRKTEKQIPIDGKCVAETRYGRIPTDNIDLSQYKKECIEIIEG